jgi:signal transduction histidine kinase
MLSKSIKLMLFLLISTISLFGNTETSFEITEYASAIKTARDKGDVELAETLAQAFYDRAVASNNQYFRGKAQYQLAVNAMTRNLYPQAIFHAEKALSYYQRSESEIEVATANSLLGRIYRYQSRYSEALEKFYQALQIFQKQENESKVASSYNSIGNVLEKMGQYQESFENHKRALQIEYQVGDTASVASSLYNLGTIRYKMGDYQLALDYLNDALKIDEEIGVLQDIAYSNNRIALILQAMGEPKQAIPHVQKAIELFQTIQARRDIDWANSVYAKILFSSGEIEQAKLLIKGVIERSQKNNYQSLLIDAYVIISEIYIQESQYAEAENYINLGLKLSNDNQEMAQQAFFNGLLVDLYAKDNAYQNAFEALQQQKLLNDKILDEKRLDGIAQLQAESEYVRKAHTIQLLERDRALQNAQLSQQKLESQLEIEARQRVLIELQMDNANTQLALSEERYSRQASMFVFIVIIAVFAMLLILLFQRRKLAELKAQNAKQLVERKNKMLSDVSHELRTPLTTIKLQIEMLEHELAEDPKQAYSLVHSKIASLNYLISNLFQLAKADSGDLELHFQNVKIREWLNSLLSQQRQELIEHELSLTCQLEIDDELVFECDIERIKQVIENLMSNACRYTDKGGQVVFKCYKQAQQIVLSIEDSAPGVDDQDLPHLFERLYRADKSRSSLSGGSGIGLSIVKAYVVAHKGRVWASQSDLGGLKIELFFPVSQHAQMKRI